MYFKCIYIYCIYIYMYLYLKVFILVQREAQYKSTKKLYVLY